MIERYLLIFILFLSSCDDTKHNNKQTLFQEEVLVNDKKQFELNIEALDKLNFKPPKFKGKAKLKTRTTILKNENRIVQIDSFNLNSEHIYSGIKKNFPTEKMSLNEYGLIDTLFAIERDVVTKTIKELIPIKFFEYFIKNKIVYRVAYEVQNGIKADYFYFEQFHYQDLILSKTYHWKYGGSGEHYRYYYSDLGKLDSLRSYRGPNRFKTFYVIRSKFENQTVETLIQDNGDTSRIKVYNKNDLLINEDVYSKPNPYQKTSYQKKYGYSYEFYKE